MATETGQRRDLAMMGGHVEGGYARAALDVIEAMLHPQSRELIVNTVNQGAIADLDDADVVEVPSRVGPDGPDPRSMGGLPVAVRDLVLRVKAYERATVAAAVHRTWRIKGRHPRQYPPQQLHPGGRRGQRDRAAWRGEA